MIAAAASIVIVLNISTSATRTTHCYYTLLETVLVRLIFLYTYLRQQTASSDHHTIDLRLRILVVEYRGHLGIDVFVGLGAVCVAPTHLLFIYVLQNSQFKSNNYIKNEPLRHLMSISNFN